MMIRVVSTGTGEVVRVELDGVRYKPTASSSGWHPQAIPERAASGGVVIDIELAEPEGEAETVVDG